MTDDRWQGLVPALARRPPALASAARHHHDEAASHVVPVIQEGQVGQFGFLLEARGRKIAYVTAARQRDGWRVVKWVTRSLRKRR